LSDSSTSLASLSTSSSLFLGTYATLLSLKEQGLNYKNNIEKYLDKAAFKPCLFFKYSTTKIKAVKITEVQQRYKISPPVSSIS